MRRTAEDGPLHPHPRRVWWRDTERLVPWAAALAVAIPVLAYRYPPMFDLPEHEEIVAAMRHFWDAEYYPPGLLAWNLWHPNQLFYLLGFCFAWAFRADTACKIVLAASVAAAPLAAARLADHLGVTRWCAVLVAPLAVGFAFSFGFVGNVLAFAALLASLPSLDRFARSPSAAGAGVATALLFLLYEAHEAALVFGALAVAALSLGRVPTPRGTVLRALPLAASGALVVAEQVRGRTEAGPNLLELPPVIDLALWQKLDGAPQALLGRHGQATTLPPFLLLAAALVLFAVDRLRGPAPAPALAPGPAPQMERLRALIDAHRFALLGLVYLVGYFEVPFAFQGAMWLHARFLAPGVALLAVAGAPRRTPSAPGKLVALAAMASLAAVILPEFRATSALYRDLDPLLSRIGKGSAVAHVDMVGGSVDGLVFSVGGAAARASAERGGRMAVSFLQTSPIPPVVIAREHRWDGALRRITHDGGGLVPGFDLRRFRYVLAWTLQGQDGPVLRALSPEARLIGRSGGWLLLESALPLDPLLAPEPPFPGGDSVRARLATAPSPAARR